ncbi:MAG TPA: hypothetical protein VFP13_09795 [Actinomycetota bacterium]|nr:hypothetical protein [Actinomycetota bacterium]
MADGLEGRIDDLYALPLERFTPERDALSKELAAAGDREGAARVKALRKPVVAAWAVNALAREDPDGIRALVEMGETLRSAHRRAVSGGDVEPFRTATEERRRLVSDLTRGAGSILERVGGATAATTDAIAGTLEAATVDEETAELVRAGRLTKPVRPPATFAGAGLRVLEGGPSRPAAPDAPPKPKPDRAKLRRELSAAETRERRAAAAVERERAAIADLDRRRSEAKDRLRAAEAELRGVSLERKRLANALDKLGDR